MHIKVDLIFLKLRNHKKDARNKENSFTWIYIWISYLFSSYEAKLIYYYIFSRFTLQSNTWNLWFCFLELKMIKGIFLSFTSNTYAQHCIMIINTSPKYAFETLRLENNVQMTSGIFFISSTLFFLLCKTLKVFWIKKCHFIFICCSIILPFIWSNFVAFWVTRHYFAS